VPLVGLSASANDLQTQQPQGLLKNSIRGATAVSAVRETSPLSNFGTVDTAVAHVFQRAAKFLL